ncbi:hypothetical protein [Cohnella sp. REN36]|nr:hypothetical protein [Cohnella sp. REN36]
MQLRPTLQLARVDRAQTTASPSPEQGASLFLAMRRGREPPSS